MNNHTVNFANKEKLLKVILQVADSKNTLKANKDGSFSSVGYLGRTWECLKSIIGKVNLTSIVGYQFFLELKYGTEKGWLQAEDIPLLQRSLNRIQEQEKNKDHIPLQKLIELISRKTEFLKTPLDPFYKKCADVCKKEYQNELEPTFLLKRLWSHKKLPPKSESVPLELPKIELVVFVTTVSPLPEIEPPEQPAVQPEEKLPEPAATEQSQKGGNGMKWIAVATVGLAVLVSYFLYRSYNAEAPVIPPPPLPSSSDTICPVFSWGNTCLASHIIQEAATPIVNNSNTTLAEHVFTPMSNITPGDTLCPVFSWGNTCPASQVIQRAAAQVFTPSISNVMKCVNDMFPPLADILTSSTDHNLETILQEETISPVLLATETAPSGMQAMENALYAGKIAGSVLWNVGKFTGKAALSVESLAEKILRNPFGKIYIIGMLFVARGIYRKAKEVFEHKKLEKLKTILDPRTFKAAHGMQEQEDQEKEIKRIERKNAIFASIKEKGWGQAILDRVREINFQAPPPDPKDI